MADTDTDYILFDVLGRIPSVRVKKMFGSHGVYYDGAFVAIVHDGRLYVKEKVSEKQFTYEKKGVPVTLGFYVFADIEDIDGIKECFERIVQTIKNP
ncbi:MAG TPA: TfoX/Sxy family protein [Acidobacteriota bacterium]|nr:TfoX/Sxy family protein [Acidobacteriota bacterium]